MNEIEVRDKLIADGVAGGRIYRTLAPDNVQYPYVRFTVQKTPLVQDMISNDGWRNTFMFQVYGQTFEQAKLAQIELQQSMKLIGREITYTDDEYPDPETGSYRIINDWFVNELN